MGDPVFNDDITADGFVRYMQGDSHCLRCGQNMSPYDKYKESRRRQKRLSLFVKISLYFFSMLTLMFLAAVLYNHLSYTTPARIYF